MQLFPGKANQEQEVQPSTEDKVDEELHEDYDKEARPMENETPTEPIGLTLALVKHTPIANSRYHKWLTQEMATSNIQRKDLPLFQMDFAIISLAEYMGLDEIAKDYHFDVEVALQLNRSVDGFERKQEGTTTQNIRKSVSEEKTGGQGFLGRK